MTAEYSEWDKAFRRREEAVKRFDKARKAKTVDLAPYKCAMDDAQADYVAFCRERF